MKRFVSILLGVAIFIGLIGCTAATAPSPTSMPTATSTISEAGGQQVFLPKGDTPQGAYEPISQPVRFYESVRKTLIPSDEYGHIWPFSGALYTAYGESTSLYGLCDDRGRIICDPIYHYVSELDKDGAKLYRFMRYLKFEKGKATERISKITLARPDGTWAEEYDEMQTESQSWEYSPVKPTSDSREFGWRRSSIKLEYITVRKGDKWGVVDYNGNEILPCSYSSPLCFSEGLASVVSEDGKSVYFIDISGKITLGPFEIPPKYDEANTMRLPLNYGLVFSEGRVHFYKDDKFGVIDKSGKIIVPAIYDYVSAYSGGTAKFLSGGKWGVLGVNGEVLMQPTDRNFNNAGNKTVLFYNRETYKTSYYNLITKEETSKAEAPAQKYIFNGTMLTLKTKNGDKTFTGVLTCIELKNGNFAIGFKSDNLTWKIINAEGDTVSGPYNGQIGYGNKDGSLIFVHSYTSEDKSSGRSYQMTVYDETGKRKLPDTYYSIQIFDGRYLVRTDTAMGLIEDGGKWVIRIPLYEFMGD